jgi:HD-GYP domain-containing protein (c-di-GMP phosphodiesterase class II)
MATVATRLRLADLLAGLSMVADMGYGLPVGQAMRSCLIGVALARRFGLADDDVADTFYTSLLLHVGCVGFSHEMSTHFGDEHTANRAGARTNFATPKDVLATLIPQATRGLAPPARLKAAAFIATRGRALGRQYDTTVCEVGRETARRIGLPDGVQRGLYEAREWWNGAGTPRGLKGEEIVLPARIARVAADAALFGDLGGTELAVDALTNRAGGMFDPAIVAAFTANPSILAESDADDPRQRILEAEPVPVVEKDVAELPQVAAAFGDLGDLKTPFTHGHSKEVARLAKAAAEALGLETQAVGRLQVAASLHDLGRVGVSNAVWEKPGPLSSADWEQVRLHPYHSERILATSEVLEPMARIAGLHHERLDGSGYHRGCRARDLSSAARVLAAADAFQAMTETRPHRQALTSTQAGEELVRDARAGQLDPDAVAAVVEAADQKRAARGRDLRPAGLSGREIEVLRLVTRACSNREIAEHLHISPRTAEHHVQHIYAKIGVSSRSAAALFALDHELLPPASDL